MIAASRPNGNDLRSQLYQIVQALPGLHVAALARESGLAEANVRYHIQVLVRKGLAIEVPCDPLRRYYPTPTKNQMVLGAKQKKMLAALRRPVPLGMILHLLNHHPRTMGELARATNVSPGTATYHVRKLEKLEIIAVQGQGKNRFVYLQNPEEVSALLAHYPPSKDMVGSFIEMFDQF